VSSRSTFDPIPLLGALAEGEVDFVVIGGIAGGAHGSAYPTYDLDVAYDRDRDNLERLTRVLLSLDARLRGAPANVPFQLDAKTIAEGGNFTFETKYGPLDILAYPEGAASYDRLRADSVVIRVASREIRVASLDHLIAMKETAGRTKDKLMALEYRTLADLQRQS
jgi:hypothetical protein